MPIYVSDDLMYAVFKDLFDGIQAKDPTASESMLRSGLVIRFQCHNPTAQVTFDARQAPLKIDYGPSATQPQISISLSADAMHCILLGELGIRKAMGRGLLDLKGPIWKVIALSDLFNRSQDLYPGVLHEYGLPANCPQNLT
jgi:hypothetical protein